MLRQNSGATGAIKSMTYEPLMARRCNKQIFKTNADLQFRFIVTTRHGIFGCVVMLSEGSFQIKPSWLAAKLGERTKCPRK